MALRDENPLVVVATNVALAALLVVGLAALLGAPDLWAALWPVGCLAAAGANIVSVRLVAAGVRPGRLFILPSIAGHICWAVAAVALALPQLSWGASPFEGHTTATALRCSAIALGAIGALCQKRASGPRPAAEGQLDRRLLASLVRLSQLALVGAVLDGCMQSSLQRVAAVPVAPATVPAGPAELASHRASAPAPATLTLGGGQYWVRESPTGTGTFAGLTYPACLSNTSGEPVWYFAQLPEVPWARKWVVPPGGSDWSDETFQRCGLGVKLHELAPGESVSFKESVSIDKVGGRLRVEIDLYSGPTSTSSRYLVRSAEVAIQ